MSTRMSWLARSMVATSVLAGLLTIVLVGGVKVAHSEQAPLTGNAAAANQGGSPTTQGHASDKATARHAGALEGQVKSVYERVSSAVVKVEWTSGKISSGCSGVIVSAEGHVLITNFPANAKFTFGLSDGSSGTGSGLGWSREWGIGLAKLDGPGPWPHVEFRGSPGVTSGQCVITLVHPVSTHESTIAPRPLLGIDWVNRSANGLWFMTATTLPEGWNTSGVAFDTNGQVVGIESVGFPREGSVFTEVKLIESLWDDLSAGKNIDRVRLAGRTQVAGRDPAAKKAITEEVEKQATATTVQIRRQVNEKGFSGVIVNKDGLVATCAHHFIMPGTKVVVSLPDGRDVAGEVQGISFPSDIGLVRITELGSFPHAEMGDSTRVLPGEPCLVIGYGPVDVKARLPQVSRQSIVEFPDGCWSHELPTDGSKFASGDCGGGVFDADGRLVAIALPGSQRPHGHKRIELLRQHWDELHAPFDRTSASGLATTETDIRQAAEGIRHSVVEVLNNDKAVALGTIVSADGRILTKASMLPEVPRCRLSDGRVLPATVLKTVREHDLAVLKIQAADLRTVELSETVHPPVGTLVAVVADTALPAVGDISHAALSFPAERGSLRASLQDSENGLEVSALDDTWDGPPFATIGPQLLRKGDIIVSIDGHAVPNRKAYLDLFWNDKSNPIAIAGDSVRLAAIREGKQLELAHVLGPPNWPRLAGQSARCSGFSQVYSVAATSKSMLCGGPVLDRQGRLLGIAIAWREKGWLFVLPAPTAKTVIAKLPGRLRSEDTHALGLGEAWSANSSEH